MSQVLTVELQEPQFRILKQVAEKLGKEPGEVGADWIAAALQRVIDDPLLRFAGAVNSGVPDLAERHDYYLGQELMKEMRGGDER